MRYLPAVLTPALPHMITDPSQLPALPDWYPLDRRPTDDLPDPAPYTREQRAHLRAQAALAEAVQGPYDGQRLRVAVPEGSSPPARFTPENAPTVWYTLDERASNEHQLVYRYDPSCYLHAQLIKAVEDGFTEHADRQYAMAAREDDTDAPGYGDAHPGGTDG